MPADESSMPSRLAWDSPELSEVLCTPAGWPIIPGFPSELCGRRGAAAVPTPACAPQAILTCGSSVRGGARRNSY